MDSQHSKHAIKILASPLAKNAMQARLDALAKRLDTTIEVISTDRVGGVQTVADIDIALFSRDIYEGSNQKGLASSARQFFSLLDEASGLKWLHIFSSGADRPVYSELASRGVLTTTSAGANSKSVALMALTGILALYKKFPLYIRAKAQKEWVRPAMEDFPRALEGQRIVIIGTGHVGSELARMASLFGMHTIGLNRTGNLVERFDEVHAIDQLERIAARVEWLVICCPLTPRTRGLVDAKIIAALGSHAHIVNVGRGGVLDESALLHALSEKHIAGAYLDVFHSEPLPSESPLWALDNLLITPHAAAHSGDVMERVIDIFIQNVEHWLMRKPLLNMFTPPAV
ncbi:D-2-hydroxyacid dehydrogenase [Bordetella sp. 02P26C-1]|uniref:D-2-hydroxyacid dehydrogenase n=1 Tax=Bordetella sp. 02P26C-1 TaxID=2683195 RepID=UPI001355A612|nr:D-2-hydroxyacid dehydrogenase [Bordetella sp. 02P26C-1]MVW79624.1 D-2-hydroxyacid dehydrogenase [Bordetella sp. 02P26C-1]